MAVRFVIPGYLRDFTGGRSTIELKTAPATVQAALQALWDLHPGLRDRVVDEQGQVREHVNIFVGNENIRSTGGLFTRVEGSCEILIVPAVSGG